MKILERLRQTNSLRISIFVPLILALILLLGSMVIILQHSQQKVLEQELAVKTREVEKLFLEYRNKDAKMLSLALSTLTLNKDLVSACKARDGTRLHDQTKSYFERLKTHYEVTHLYFTGPDRVTILRLHQPDRYGDRIDRFTAVEAEKSGRESQGVELGPLGTFTLRVVTPWYDGESLLGYVELGMEIEHTLKELKRILDSNVYAFIHKDYIQREGWEAGIRMLGHKEEWGHFPDAVIIGELLNQVPEKVAQTIAGKQTLQPATDIHINGTYYRVAFIPLIDAGKREIGHISILLDTTAKVSAFHRSVLLICIFYVLVGAALFVFFYAFLGQIEKKQKWLEESRLEFEQGFRNIFDNANDGIMLADIENKKLYLGNKMICRMLGYGPEEIKTLGVADIHPEKDLPRVVDQFTLMQRREYAIAENFPVKRKDGTVFYADISSSLATLGGKSYLVGIFRDITERKRAEEEIRRLNAELETKVQERTRQLLEAQEELVRKEKLSILGQLSGSVGHELRNPLGVMNNAVYFLQMVLSDADDTVGEYLDIIKKEIDNSLRIITDLLDFARTKTPQIQTVAACALIDESLGRCTFPENVALQTEIPDSLPLLSLDPLQMGQVLQNLITNGIQAMPDGGTIRVGACFAGAPTGGHPQGDGHGEPVLQNFVEISVTDTGEGISPENMKKLFQPLFTTKAKGIGLGLVVCRNLAEANGGRIAVSSEPGQGTTFTVTLPAGGR